jgi:hypothetical protein
VVKHLAGGSLTPLARLLNICLKLHKPPTAWKHLKLTALYKGKGAAACADSYRALAVGHPLAKLAMGVVTARLEQQSEER